MVSSTCEYKQNLLLIQIRIVENLFTIEGFCVLKVLLLNNLNGSCKSVANIEVFSKVWANSGAICIPNPTQMQSFFL